MKEFFVDTVRLFSLAEKLYSKDKLMHAIRVATYSMDKASQSNWADPIHAYAVGLAHDLLEDTECCTTDLMGVMGSGLIDVVIELTHSEKDEDYDQYIMRIIRQGSDLAKLVKGADMKDHFMQDKTLTDKLRAKYMPYIKYFL